MAVEDFDLFLELLLGLRTMGATEDELVAW